MHNKRKCAMRKWHRESCGGANLDAPVLVHQQVGRLEVAVDDGWV